MSFVRKSAISRLRHRIIGYLRLPRIVSDRGSEQPCSPYDFDLAFLPSLQYFYSIIHQLSQPGLNIIVDPVGIYQNDIYQSVKC